MNDPLGNPGPLIERVYAYVAYRVGHGADAEDVTSAAFERALRYRGSFDSRRGDAATWLIGIARRCIADAALDHEVPLGELPDVQTPGHADPAHLRVDLAAALATLDARDRELVALRYGSDLTARQIAEVMELKTNAVEVALHRALARLRAALADDTPGRPARSSGVRPATTDASVS